MKYTLIRDDRLSERFDFLRRLFSTSQVGEHQVGLHLLGETEEIIDDIDNLIHMLNQNESTDGLYELILNTSYIIISLDYVFQLIVGGTKLHDELDDELNDKIMNLMGIRDHLLSRANIQFGVEAYMNDYVNTPYHYKGVYSSYIANKLFSGYEAEGEYVIVLEDADGNISTLDVDISEDIIDTLKQYLDHFLTYIEHFKESAKKANIPADKLEDASIDSIISSLYLDLATLYPDEVKYDKEGNLDKTSFPLIYRVEKVLAENLSNEYYHQVDQIFKRVLIDAVDDFKETVDQKEPNFEIIEDLFDFPRDLIYEDLEDSGFSGYYIPCLEDSEEVIDVEDFRQKLLDCDEDIEYMEDNFSTFELAIYQIMALVDDEVLSTYIPIDLTGKEIFRMFELCQFQDLATDMFEEEGFDLDSFDDDEFDDDFDEYLEEDEEETKEN